MGIINFPLYSFNHNTLRSLLFSSFSTTAPSPRFVDSCDGYYTHWGEWRDYCPDGYTDCGGFCDFDSDCYGDDWCGISAGMHGDCRLDCGEAPQDGCWADGSCWDSSDGAPQL